MALCIIQNLQHNFWTWVWPSQFPRPTCFLSEAENLSRLWPSDYDDDGDMCYQIQNSFLKITNIVVLSLCRRIWPVFKVPSSWLWYMEVYLPRMMPRAMVPDTMTMMMMLMMMLIYCFVHHEIFNRLHWRKEKQWNANVNSATYLFLSFHCWKIVNIKLKVSSFHNISKIGSLSVWRTGNNQLVSILSQKARPKILWSISICTIFIVVNKYLHYYHCGQ